MSTFLLILLTILSSAGAGYLYGWLTGEEDGGEPFSDPTADAHQLWSDISADVQRAEEQIQQLKQPRPRRSPR